MTVNSKSSSHQSLLIDKILAYCEAGRNKLFFSKSGIEDGNGAFIKSYTICEDVNYCALI
jgi:hypothetical protein